MNVVSAVGLNPVTVSLKTHLSTHLKIHLQELVKDKRLKTPVEFRWTGSWLICWGFEKKKKKQQFDVNESMVETLWCICQSENINIQHRL